MPSIGRHYRQLTTLRWQYVLDPWLAATAIWCLFSFKLFLVSFGEAGLRLDDLMLLASFGGLLLATRIRRTPLSLPLRLYLVYVAVQLASAAWNGFEGRVPFLYSLVFVLRLLEYLIFYYIGYSLARTRFDYCRLATIYFGVLCVVVPLQMIGLLPVPGSFGVSRASGNTNGPYELAVVCGFLLCFLAYRYRRLLMGVTLLAGVVLTGSRITLVACMLSVLHYGLAQTRSRLKIAGGAVIVAVLALGVYLAFSNGLLASGPLARVQNSKSYSLSDLPDVYAAAPTVRTASEYFRGPFEDLNGFDVGNFDGDLSGIIRFTRWITLVKATVAHTDSIVIGLGPSFGSAAVDGYFTRCFVETGVLGMLSFCIFIASLLFTRRGSNWYFREYVLIMAVSACFIDIFLSYKCMMLLWLWHGMNQYSQEGPAQVHVTTTSLPSAFNPTLPVGQTA